MNYFKTFYFFLIINIIIILPSCKRGDKIIIIDNMSKDSIYKVDLGFNPYGKILLHIKGEVNDSIKINHAYFSGGTIDTTLQQDWFTNQVAIYFYKLKASKGNLIISVK